MSGVLCRCFTHVRMLRAIERYAKQEMRKVKSRRNSSGTIRARCADAGRARGA